jgi:hypothetical protein
MLGSLGGRRLAFGAVALLGMVVVPSVARANDPVAEQLFLEAKNLMAQGDVAGACAKFKASHDIDTTATGTLLNLALCHEKLGKNATAWSEFRQVAAESQNRRQDRVDMAQEHATALFPKLSHVKFIVPAATRVPGLALKLDDEKPMASATWDVAVPVDPGKHVLTASAPDKVTGTQTFVVGTDPVAQDVVVAPLNDAPKTVSLEEDESDALRKRRIVGIALVGAGAVAVIVGSVFGLRAIGQNNDAVGRCPPNRVCATPALATSSNRDIDSATSSALISTILFASGLVVAGGGVVLTLTARASKQDASGFAVTGRW